MNYAPSFTVLSLRALEESEGDVHYEARRDELRLKALIYSNLAVAEMIGKHLEISSEQTIEMWTIDENVKLHKQLDIALTYIKAYLGVGLYESTEKLLEFIAQRCNDTGINITIQGNKI